MIGSNSIATGRFGIVMRVTAHGSVMVFDPETRRSYPFYKAGFETYYAMEEVRFVTDGTDTVIVSMQRVGGSSEVKPLQNVIRGEARAAARI